MPKAQSLSPIITPHTLTSDMVLISSSKCFGGHQKVYEHSSRELHCRMKFSIFIPSGADPIGLTKLPILFFLSGLTCDHTNMTVKSGIQRYAEQYQLVIVAPDTSPRNCNVPGEENDWDLGTGASFYVDATQEPWNRHYRMYSYITREIRDVVDRNFPFVDGTRAGITGHSMGGHGALVCFLRNPQIYRAVSAFAPISNPINSGWGRKCMSNYLGPDINAWREYDATELVKRQPQKSVTIIVEQGDRDEWYDQLVPDNFVEACRSVGQPLQFNQRGGYDHGYHFVSTFIGEHVKHFADVLHRPPSNISP